jgi:hypothetical protein
MTVKKLIQSYPRSKNGRGIPCEDGSYVLLHHVETKEHLAIYILYDYEEKKVFLPSTVLSYCALPEQSISQEYDEIVGPFLKKMASDRFYFQFGTLYQHCVEEIKTLLEDLTEGGNYQTTRENALDMWVHYRVLFRDEDYSTMAVVKANPVLCQKYNITYAGPLIF